MEKDLKNLENLKNSNNFENQEELVNFFENKDLKREKILKLSREIVRNCGIIIRKIQKDEEVSFDELTTDLNNLHAHTTEFPEFKKYLGTPQQEYVEAKAYHLITTYKKIPTYAELKEECVTLSKESYILGLCDTIGELRRKVLDCISKDNKDDAEFYNETMEILYDFIMKFDYYHVIDNLRRKQDVSRSLVEKTNGDFVNFIENLKLRNELKKLQK
ncbi:translin [Methanococcus voltae]|uniref:Translin n=2 Tax=Methanococcus voltae TaxID=2188 RepID=A0A8J7URQ4_METVO|nr:haloacid dehalogenase [Methanococcus voltae]MBP2200862.1 translin [Methanococcus voltae]MCS3921586.1 translin [Methanococcus voltae PS]